MTVVARTFSTSCLPVVLLPPEMENILPPRKLHSGMLRLALAMPYRWAVSFILLYCSGTQIQKPSVMLPQVFGAVLTLVDLSGGTVFHTSVFVNINMPFRDALACRRALSSSSNHIQRSLGISVVMHLLIWFMKSAIQYAIYTSIIGLLYGPHVTVWRKIFCQPKYICLGGAIFPLMAGAIFDAKGVSKLTYVTVPVAAALWAVLLSRLRHARLFTRNYRTSLLSIWGFWGSPFSTFPFHLLGISA